MNTDTLAKPVRAVGGFYALSLDTLMAIPKRPFAWRELVFQTWFVARVSMVPTLMLVVPFTVLTVFIVNILLTEIGAADLSGSGAARHRHADGSRRHRSGGGRGRGDGHVC